MDPKDIQALLEKYRSGQASPEEERLLHHWLDGLAETAEPFILKADEKARLHNTMWQHIEANAHRRPRRLWRYAAAATLAGAIALAAAWLLRPQTPETLSMTTAAGEVRTFILSDQSRVTAGPNSKLVFEEVAGQRQVKLLQGKAYFEVQGSAEKPFTVFMGTDTVTVLGTAFTMERPGCGNTRRITLLSGKVKASGHGILAPGQRLTYPQKQIDTIQHSDALAWTKGEILLQNATLSDVIHTLEDQYGITVSTALDRRAGSYTFRFPAGMPLQQVLDILQKISYKPKISFTMKQHQLTIR